MLRNNGCDSLKKKNIVCGYVDVLIHTKCNVIFIQSYSHVGL